MQTLYIQIFYTKHTVACFSHKVSPFKVIVYLKYLLSLQGPMGVPGFQGSDGVPVSRQMQTVSINFLNEVSCH